MAGIGRMKEQWGYACKVPCKWLKKHRFQLTDHYKIEIARGDLYLLALNAERYFDLLKRSYLTKVLGVSHNGRKLS